MVGGLTRKLGKKKTAFGGLLFGSLILSFFMLIKNPIGIIALTFTSSCFISLSWPAISGAYADYISETPSVEGEVEALEDFAFNLAYVLGPFFAGVLADLCGIAASFTILGIFGAVISLLLFGTAKREIKIDIDVSMLN